MSNHKFRGAKVMKPYIIWLFYNATVPHNKTIAMEMSSSNLLQSNNSIV